MKNINTSEYYFKAEQVIDSCKNEEQLRIALRYVELYNTLTKDKSGYEVLIRKFYKRHNQLTLNEKTKTS